MDVVGSWPGKGRRTVEVLVVEVVGGVEESGGLVCSVPVFRGWRWW